MSLILTSGVAGHLPIVAVSSGGVCELNQLEFFGPSRGVCSMSTAPGVAHVCACPNTASSESASKMVVDDSESVSGSGENRIQVRRIQNGIQPCLNLPWTRTGNPLTHGPR